MELEIIDKRSSQRNQDEPVIVPVSYRDLAAATRTYDPPRPIGVELEIIDKRSSQRNQDEPVIVPVSYRDLAAATRTYDPPRPIGDRIMITRNEEETVFQGTPFIIPDSVRKASNKGVVVAVGPKITDECKVGDVVTFSVFNAETHKIGDEVFAICRIDDVKLVESVNIISAEISFSDYRMRLEEEKQRAQ